MTDQTNPFASAYALYVAAGWEGTLTLPYLRKAAPKPDYTGAEGRYPDHATRIRWAKRGPDNIGIRLPNSVIGIDVDQYVKNGKQKNGAVQLAEFESKYGRLAPTWRSTRRELENPSGIRFYRVPEGTVLPDKLDDDIDIIQWWHRYAVVWPSCVHEDEKDPTTDLLGYAWVAPETEVEAGRVPLLSELAALTERQIQGIREQGRSTSTRETEKAEAKRPIWLPPNDPGRTNDWLTLVAGHLARGFRNNHDLYRDLVRLVDSRSADPQELDRVDATADSVWKGELKRREIAGEGTSATGWLVSQRTRLMVIEDEGEAEFANFDMRVTGKVRAADGTLDGYNVVLTDDRTKRKIETHLPIRVLTDQRKLPAWLAGHEVAVLYGVSRGPSVTTRLATYLAAQQAPDVRIVAFWGWDDEAAGFVTDVGVIRADGLEVTQTIKPNPDLVTRKLVSHRYGFETSPEDAVALLREILTFQDPTVTSVVGAWWMATKLKGQIMRIASLFPVLVVEAASESGKTTGFFELLYAMDGNTDQQAVATAAAFRSQLTAHRNGYVWLDDQRELDEKTKEAIRGATAEKQADKMDTSDNMTVISARLVAPIMLSGEGFGLNDEKALPDRVIQIDLPSPKGRMSLHDPTRSQWDDIVQFKADNPDLTTAAGTLTQLALQQAELVEQLGSLRPSGGRHGDKLAVIRLGARVLAAVTGDPSHIDRVDAWCGLQKDTGAENALTKLLIPTALHFLGSVEDPVVSDPPPGHGLPTPVLVKPDKEGTLGLWVSIPLLAEWWARHNRGGAEVRLHTQTALEAQAKALDMKSQKAGTSGIDYIRPRVNGRLHGYQRVPMHIAERLLEDYEHNPGGAQRGGSTRGRGGSTLAKSLLANHARQQARHSASSTTNDA